jgi:hypothetical protein
MTCLFFLSRHRSHGIIHSPSFVHGIDWAMKVTWLAGASSEEVCYYLGPEAGRVPVHGQTLPATS